MIAKIKDGQQNADHKDQIVGPSFKLNISNIIEKVNDESNIEYQSAIANIDLKTAQKLVDDAAKKAGYSIKAYHGSLFFFVYIIFMTLT